MAYLTSISDRHIIYNLKLLSHLCFEVTEACNLNCAYCAFSDISRISDEFSISGPILDDPLSNKQL